MLRNARNDHRYLAESKSEAVLQPKSNGAKSNNTAKIPPGSAPKVVVQRGKIPPEVNLNTSSTTSFLIFIVHVVFFYQWNLRKRPSNNCCYRTVVQKKQFHRICLAILSHPPSKRGHSSPTSSRRESGGGSGGNTNNDGNNNSQNSNTQQQEEGFRGQLASQARQFKSWALQSGFALLLYNSHILWQCRALEAFYIFNQGADFDDFQKLNATPQPRQYARVLFGLTATAILVQFRFFFNLLRISKKLEGSEFSAITIPRSESNNANNRVRNKILDRPVGTLTGLSCALIVVFQHHFEFVPLQVLPFVDNRCLLFGFSMPSTLTSLLCWGILGYLSYATHPIDPILCGLASGSLWALGLTSFLQEEYWGNSIMAAFGLICCISMRASKITRHEAGNDAQRTAATLSTPTYIPCIDHVSPAYCGGQELDEGDRSTSHSTHSEDGDLSDDDDGSSHASSSRDSASLDEPDSDSSNDLELIPLLEHDRSQSVRARRGASNV